MKNQRIVFLVVADAAGTFIPIGGDELTDRIRRTLHAYEFTERGIEAVIQVILGNDEVPVRFEHDATDDADDEQPLVM